MSNYTNYNITVGRGATVHAAKNDIAECGASNSRNGRERAGSYTSQPVDCGRCLKVIAADHAAALEMNAPAPAPINGSIIGHLDLFGGGGIR